MGKMYDVEIFEKTDEESVMTNHRRWLGLVRMHKSDDLAVFVVGENEADVLRRATAIGERWQAQWDADQENREKRIEAARIGREKRALKLAGEAQSNTSSEAGQALGCKSEGGVSAPSSDNPST